MPHQIVLNYLSSKTNFVFNQTLYTPFRERDAVITSSNFFIRPFGKSYSLTKVKFYLVNSSNPAKKTKKTRVYYVSTRDISGSNSPPFQRNVQIPPSPGTMYRQMPGVCPGGMLKFRIDRRINYIRQ